MAFARHISILYQATKRLTALWSPKSSRRTGVPDDWYVVTFLQQLATTFKSPSHDPLNFIRSVQNWERQSIGPSIPGKLARPLRVR